MARVVIGVRRLLGIYVGLVGAAIFAWWWVSEALVTALFMGAYVGSTLTVAGVTVYALAVGLENVAVRWP